MVSSILQKIREDISVYLNSNKPSKLYQLRGFDHATGDEVFLDILLDEEDLDFINANRDNADSSIFNVKFFNHPIPFHKKIDDVIEKRVEYGEAWEIDISKYTFPLEFTVSQIEDPFSLPKNTEFAINIIKDDMENLLFSIAKYWVGGNRSITYYEIYEFLSKYVRGVDLPYVIFCDYLNNILASIIGPYNINELIFENRRLQYPDDYNWMMEGGVIIADTLSLCGYKLELLSNSLNEGGYKDRTIRADFAELMIKLGCLDRYEAFNKLKSMLKEGGCETVETFITILQENSIRYCDELNTWSSSHY